MERTYDPVNENEICGYDIIKKKTTTCDVIDIDRFIKKPYTVMTRSRVMYED